MKRIFRHLILLTLIAMPAVASAQSNIKKAFDAIINCKQAQITESHSLDKEPDTNKKTGQCDIYNFVLPVEDINLVNNVIAAFHKDNELAYSFKSGTSQPKDEHSIVLAAGEGNDNGVQLSEWGSDYMYALFLAPSSEDKERRHRYAYGLSYKKEKGKITGKLLVTYATTLKVRQDAAQARQGAIVVVAESWFDQVMNCLQKMRISDPTQRMRLASKVYSLIRDSSKYQDVTDADKDTIREVLKAMLTEKEYYSNPVVYSLLNRCLVTLK
ncbi:MAG: hypothetical protein K2H48_04200 [Duncaniella sp.]|nr:hypothetical protein [Duncaniella sp.]